MYLTRHRYKYENTKCRVQVWRRTFLYSFSAAFRKSHCPARIAGKKLQPQPIPGLKCGCRCMLAALVRRSALGFCPISFFVPLRTAFENRSLTTTRAPRISFSFLPNCVSYTILMAPKRKAQSESEEVRVEPWHPLAKWGNRDRNIQR